ncbi:YdeI/OmpD-associated family protein [Phycicoccus endophyticus]|uniref:YdeI/OmpD-associated family protein n=1 Tax=Phycicoccus endophyticus TaxID=1690220 RepID=A0A7G9R3X8_9MICO|nr:YdeI/OmpD-associated family protein [Phycicoccus endophyticus]NHI18137.1 YdeI/OmpD-associated family protein [Phycicoccus endophyticus]QNN50303.1 YdeI/OmpD-associated family protein [Phycicoccus endophyticus]GGL26167.1 hypothetical protein GCM10012283_05420 [Phycicoccus endophyticus]
MAPRRSPPSSSPTQPSSGAGSTRAPSGSTRTPAAAAFWDAATPSYRKIVVHWVHDAKQEATRAKRLHELVVDSAAGRLVKFQRYGNPPAWLARAAAAAAAARGS